MYDKESRKVVLLAGIGAFLEFFDFVLYMIFSKEIANTFFSAIESSTIKHFIIIAIFSVAYLVRPFAGMILGFIGDIIGRRKLLLFTIVLMGSCSLAMGLLPGYEQWGLFSSIVFVILRILQGVALGGELPGAYVIVYESVKSRMWLSVAILFTFVTVGFLFSDIVGFGLEHLFGEYAWRVGFVIGGLLGFVGYYIRKNLHETPMFEGIDKTKRISFLELFSTYKMNLISAICITIVVAFGGVMLTLYMHKFVDIVLKEKYTSGFISLILIPSVIVLTTFTFIYGYLSDRVGLMKMFKLGTLLVMIFSLPVFYIMSSFADVISVMLMSIIIMLCYSFIAATFIFFICDLFPTDVRLSGVGISYNLAFAAVGGIGPLLSTTIIEKTDSAYMGPGFVGLLCGLIGLIGILIYAKKGGYYKKINSIDVKL